MFPSEFYEQDSAKESVCGNNGNCTIVRVSSALSGVLTTSQGDLTGGGSPPTRSYTTHTHTHTHTHAHTQRERETIHNLRGPAHYVVGGASDEVDSVGERLHEFEVPPQLNRLRISGPAARHTQ